MKMALPLFLTLTLFSTSLWATSYQVITDKLPLLAKIEGISKDLYKKGRVHLVEMEKKDFLTLSEEERQYLRPMNLEQIQNDFATNPVRQEKDAQISSLVGQIDKEKMREIITHLSTYKTRYVGTEGNAQAVEWVIEQFKALGLETRTECFSAGWYADESCNAIGLKKGKSNKKYVIMGHLDTVGRAFAGADDNGSGVAAVIEMARILMNYETDASIEFVAVNAEEIGIVGSKDYVRRRVSEDKGQVIAALTMDVIGYNTQNVFSIETYPEHEQLAQDMAALGRVYTSRQVLVSLHAWGSDHVPFLDNGIPAVLTAQDWSKHNPCYHKSCDTIDKVDFDYLRDLTSVSLAYLAREISL